MVNAPTRPHGSSIIAACIVAASLIVSALIVAHKPQSATGNSVPVSIPTARPAEMPPIAQASAEEQFRAQVVAAPALHTLLYKDQTYTLTDIKVKQVIYSAKDDTFTFIYDWVWQPEMPTGGPHSGTETLTNNGYGQYFGTADFRFFDSNNSQSADVTIK